MRSQMLKTELKKGAYDVVQQSHMPITCGHVARLMRCNWKWADEVLNELVEERKIWPIKVHGRTYYRI